MKNVSKKQMFNTGRLPHRIKDIVGWLAIRSLMLLAILSACLIAGCRMFTID